MSAAFTYRISKRLCRILRHSGRIQVIETWFCWVPDLIDEMSHREHRCYATAQEDFNAVARCPNWRFHVDAIAADSRHARQFPMYTHITRAAPWHAGHVQGQISDADAHVLIKTKSQAPVCCHATKAGYFGASLVSTAQDSFLAACAFAATTRTPAAMCTAGPRMGSGVRRLPTNQRRC